MTQRWTKGEGRDHPHPNPLPSRERGSDPALGLLAFLLLGLTLAGYYFAPDLGLSAVLALAFGALAWWRLDLALPFAFATAPLYRFPKAFAPTILGHALVGGRTQPLQFSLFEFVVLACIAAWALRLIAPRPGVTRRPPQVATVREFVRPLLGPAGLLWLAATFSLAASEFLHVSLREYRTVIAEPLLFYLLLRRTAHSEAAVQRWIDFWVILGAAIALFSIYHYVFIGVVEATEGARRVLAVYHSPNALALYLGRILPIAAVVALFLPNAGWRRWAYAAACLPLLVTLFLTYSRGAWLGVAAAVLVAVALTNWWRAAVAAGVMLAALAALLPFVPLARLLSPGTSGLRLYLWQSAIDMIRDHSLLGVGLDNFLYQYPRYMRPEAWSEPNISHPHNVFLDFWTRIGILGVASAAWLQVSFWKQGLRLLRRPVSPPGAVLALALMASMTDFLIHGLIDNSFFLIDLAVTFWLTYGLMEVLGRREEMPPKSPEGGL